MKSNYLLRYHDLYVGRVSRLKDQVIELKKRLAPQDFKTHEVVKLAARIREADQNIIPQDPNKPEYQLRADLRK